VWRDNIPYRMMTFIFPVDDTMEADFLCFGAFRMIFPWVVAMKWGLLLLGGDERGWLLLCVDMNLKSLSKYTQWFFVRCMSTRLSIHHRLSMFGSTSKQQTAILFQEVTSRNLYL
jgi:hypothetical protein